jgi:hypothetical protein
MDKNGDPARIIHRDLYEFYPDIQIRRKLGLKTDQFEKTMDIEKDENFYYQQKSYLFDFKLGEYVFRPLVKTFCRDFKYPENEIINKIREIFQGSSPTWKEIFKPYEKAFCLPPLETTYKNGKPLFQDFGMPIFR